LHYLLNSATNEVIQPFSRRSQSKDIIKLGKASFMDFQVGHRLELDFDTLKCWTSLRGWVPDKIIFVDLPQNARRRDLIMQGMGCLVRYADQAGISTFRSKVERVVLGDPPLIYLSYPEDIQRQRLRSELRLKTFFHVRIWIETGASGQATVMDISRGGCLVGTQEFSLNKGDVVILGGILPNLSLFVDVPCHVRRVTEPSQIGLEFGELNATQEMSLEGYLSTAHQKVSDRGRGTGASDSVVGSLQEVALDTLALSIAASGRGYLLDLWDEPRTGRLCFESGQLVHASVGSLRGAPAFLELMRWDKGQFCLSIPSEGPHRNVFDPLDQLIMGHSGSA
jgi:c-di-GMP-binding flagellar brake protein YcgR